LSRLPAAVLVVLVAFCVVPSLASGAEPPAGSVRIGVRPARVSPGGRVRFRVECPGAEGTGYGEPFKVQQDIAGTWVRASFSPSGPWFEDLLGVQPGGVGRWESIRVPADAEPGLYRVRRFLSIGGRYRSRAALFQVVP
jgi:hypothetical protein